MTDALCHFLNYNKKEIKGFLGGINTNGIYTGYSIDFGIEINNLVNIKDIYYKYKKASEIDYGLPIYQFTFNYTMNQIGKKNKHYFCQHGVCQ